MERDGDSDRPDQQQHLYQGIYEEKPDTTPERHGDFEQADWEMQFVSALTRRLTDRHPDAGVYEVERLEWADSRMTLVVRVWFRESSHLVGWQEHLPTVRSGFTPDDPRVMAGAWHTGEFFPCYVPNPYLPGADGIHWIRRRG